MARRGDGMLSPEFAEAHEFHRVIRASVQECLETWGLQTQVAPVTPEALGLVARAAVPILRLLGGSSAGFAGTTIPGGRPPKGGEAPAPFGGERGSAAPTVVATSR